MTEARTAMWKQLRADVLEGPGTLTPEQRQRAAEGGAGLPDALAAYAARVAHEADAVTAAEHETLRQAGYSEDQIFEATVAVALGAGLRRWNAGLAALSAQES